MDTFLISLGEEVQDVDEETFHLFSQNTSSSQDLGMVDAKADEIEVPIYDRDFSIKQSPGVLQSKREGGTTGAAVWRVCVLFAEWLGWKGNPLFKSGVLDSSSIALELGSGISGLVPLILSPRVGRVVATDQQYALKLLQENIANNLPQTKAKPKQSQNNIDILALDWEASDIPSFLHSNNIRNGVDALLICDCIFNYALIQPLTQTCIEICKARASSENEGGKASPTICVIAQQLRQPDVFEEWLREFMAVFRIWRLPDGMVTEGLREGRGYVAHIGVLK